MKLKCLGCDALARIVYLCAAQSPHIVDVELFRLGLHIDPPDLRSRLQSRIDAVSQEEYDAIVLAYGLCGQATAGLMARQLPLVFPRAHDCITLFLGSRERYKDQFENSPGTYWYTLDYIERHDGVTTALSLGSGMGTDIHDVYEEYVEKYGQDNADYLMEVMGAWQSHYQRAAFIDMGVGDSTRIEAQAREEAEKRGWSFERVAGDLLLIRRLLNGEWEQDFLIVEPGHQLTMTYDDDVMGCVYAQSS
ncbi:DUF1638 domain-containing protein [candidate division KSB3 bacterium]|uniref:DUF1638 domain-containing protein n=1 Tax=candidate division KSB3 bacterium TaxID=2044937 RepID=A0A9D5JVA6_9BACT|nr:DUF1638 domain-containing protein [candidate division KSB3 bacterium]MBD3324798.1 DUF1638 domain-containing protein [candidate division KSB3 bacterium]